MPPASIKPDRASDPRYPDFTADPDAPNIPICGPTDPHVVLASHFLPPAGCEDVPMTARLGVRCTPEALAWVKGLAEHCSLDCTSIIWQSLLRQAEASGYLTRVPQRYRRKGQAPPPGPLVRPRTVV